MATGLSNAELAQAIQSLIEASDAREQDLANWQEGSPTGGPNGDGRYPLRNYRGEVRYFKSPQRLEYEVDRVVLSAAAHADRAEAARDEAVSAQLAVANSATAAQNSAAAAATSASQAQGFRQQAASHEANALTYRNAAVSSADAAAASAALAEQAKLDAEAARNDAQAAEAAAGAHAANAAASAAAAATFNPANFYFKSEVNTLLSGKADVGHTHDDRYYRKAELTTDGVLDARYYTHEQVDAVLSGKADKTHTHAIADVANLQAALDARLRVDTAAQGLTETQKSNARTNLGLGTAATASSSAFASASHQHAIADVTGLQAALDAKLPTASFTWGSLPGKPTTFAPSAHTHAIADVVGLQASLDGKADSSHTHEISDVAGLQDALDGKQPVGSYLLTTGGILTGVVDRNGGDTVAVLRTYNTSATGSPLQFFLEHSYSGVNLGNNRGPMNYFGTGHFFSHNVQSNKALIATGFEGGWSGPGAFLDYDAGVSRGRLGAYDYTQKRWLPIEIDRGNAGTLVGGTLQAKGMVRATGWWGSTGSSFSGLAAEIGIANGKAYLVSYNRDSSSYGSFELNAAHIKLAPMGGGTVEVASGMSVGSTLTVVSGDIVIGNGWRLQNGPASGYAQFSNWVHLNGAYGFYSSVNSAHLYPNTSSEYGTWRVDGARGNYNGFAFESTTNRPHLMFTANTGMGGIYFRGTAKWAVYANTDGSVCVGGRTAFDSNYGLMSARSIYAEGDVVAYSDRRKKDDIRTIEDALDKVSRMRGVTFVKKGDESLRRRMGVIAQEMMEVAPEVVDLLSDGTYAVAYGNLVGILIEAIKELKERIDGIDPRLHDPRH